MKDQQVTLQPDEGVTFNDQKVFALDIQMDAGSAAQLQIHFELCVEIVSLSIREGIPFI